eukprot:TRINITY_DN2334_c0_g1_i2.p1 TRINITY_DN2334_c0_g1~~TRINITY_DN2334_c0_g1_i2.p1  ORF type:complete len:130 (-),score=30.12 TRINITY_DN2334_c0_g1_i2:7-396(-)
MINRLLSQGTDGRLSGAKGTTYQGLTNTFDYCKTACRTHSQSVVNENTYKSKYHFCYGEHDPPVSHEDEKQQEEEQGQQGKEGEGDVERDTQGKEEKVDQNDGLSVVDLGDDRPDDELLRGGRKKKKNT